MRLGFALLAGSLTFVAFQFAYGNWSTADVPGWPQRSQLSASSAFERGQPLHCSGIEAMTPTEAGSALSARGFRVRYLLEGGAEGPLPVDAPAPNAKLRAVAAVRGSAHTVGNVTVAVPDGPGAIALVFTGPSSGPGWSMKIPVQNCG